MFRFIAITLSLCLTTITAQAALASRAGGQAYYDAATNLTWVADANLAQTSGYDADGLMTWSAAVGWVAALNAANYLGAHDWRLPTVTDTGTPGCNFAFSGTDCGWNVELATGEMARMFYGTLVNTGGYDSSGVLQPCYTTGPQYCLTNTGPFSNLQLYYWYGTEYPLDPLLVWGFMFSTGNQFVPAKDNEFYAWAVRDGDIDADGDGVVNAVDNCTLVANPTQCDSDGDGYGNHCDGDLNNNGATNAFDTPLYRAQLGQPSVGPTFNKADLNCSGGVNAFDTPLFRQLLGSPPGPSGLACAGTIPCP